MLARTRRARTGALLLWVASALLGAWAIAQFVQEILPWLFGRLGVRQSNYEVAYNCAIIVLAILWIMVVIGGGEYHRTRVGRPRSWKILIWTVGVEVVILLFAAFL